MKPALFLSSGFPDAPPLGQDSTRRVSIEDVYALPALELNDYRALLLSMHVDQRFLAKQAAQIEQFLHEGGTIVANGHAAYPFLPGLDGFHALENYGLHDLAVRRVNQHPIWEGVEPRELTFRRGVAGFYGRAWHQPPAGATVIHALGRDDRPLDFIYPVGQGRVLFHGGNDLWQFGGADSTKRIVPQFMNWLFAETAS